jgi:endonuclease YncB( thermonuclease family)
MYNVMRVNMLDSYVFGGVAFVFLACSSSVALAENKRPIASFCGTVINVSSGNHITIEDSNKKQAKVRLAWVFAPEPPQTNGLAAKMRLDKITFNRAACVDVLMSYGKKDNDPSERYYGVVSIKDLGDVGLEMLSQGMAWHYTPYAQKGQGPNDYAQYAVAERAAREQGFGIWSDKAVISPWVFQGKSIDQFK